MKCSLINHISIEGMDGVGKSTTCNLLAKKIEYKFVEKPLHYLFDKDEAEFVEYIRIRNHVNSTPNRVFTSWFYALGSIYMYQMFKGQKIITDRHIVSNYAWSGDKTNSEVYDLLIKKIGMPKLTVILYAPSSVIRQRLQKRNIHDSDIKKVKHSEQIYNKMIAFCRNKKLPHIIIDVSKLSPEEVVDEIIKELK